MLVVFFVKFFSLTARSWCVTVRPVMGQIKTGVQACVAINKKDDDRRRALSPGVQSWRWWECVFSLKSFLRHRASETGLLTGTSTQRSETGWILQLLKSLSTMLNSMFNQTAKWLQQLVMLTSSRCLHGIMKIFRPSDRVTARVLPRVTTGPAGTHPAALVHDACDNRPGRRPCSGLLQQRVTKRLTLKVTWVQLRAAAWCSCALLGRSKGVASNA
jgi:hypothetical protein